MIRIRGVAEILVDLSVAGAQAVNANARTFIVPFPARLKAIYAKLGTAGVTGTQTTDLLKNGATLVSSGTLLSFATGVQAATYNVANLTANPPLFNKGDIIEVSTTAIQTTPAKDLALLIVLEKQRSASFNDTVQTDTIGVEVDTVS